MKVKQKAWMLSIHIYKARISHRPASLQHQLPTTTAMSCSSCVQTELVLLHCSGCSSKRWLHPQGSAAPGAGQLLFIEQSMRTGAVTLKTWCVLQHQPNTQPQHKGQRSLLQIAMAESAIKTTMPKCNNKWHTSRTRSTQSLRAYRQSLPTYEMIVNNKAIPPCAHGPRSKLLGYFFYFVICIFRAFNHPETKTPFK